MSCHDRPVVLSDRFADAFAFALKLHRYQTRKGRVIPYMAHLMSVAALVLEAGGTEDEAIAALLHDAIEDQSGATSRAHIVESYGETVAAIVDACTEPTRLSHQTWRDHKQAYLEQLQNASAAAQRVILADKLHNVRSLITHLQQEGEPFWSEFAASPADYVWLYQSLEASFNQHSPDRTMAREFCRCVQTFITLAIASSKSMPSMPMQSLVPRATNPLNNRLNNRHCLHDSVAGRESHQQT